MSSTEKERIEETASRFFLSDWHVDVQSNRLSSGDTVVKLESKVMAVLVYLAQHQGELVTRESLEKAVWGNTIVGYDALTRCIARLRKAFNDDPRQPAFIETISKKGYRLIAPVTYKDKDSVSRVDSLVQELEKQSDDIVTPGRSKKSWVLVIGLSLILIAILPQLDIWQDSEIVERTQDKPSIVVLPFVNLSDDADQLYFSEGITADITTALSKLSGLKVISQSSSMNNEAILANTKDLADRLGVRYVLEGSVRRTDDRIRVNVRLVDALSDVYLWSEKYDRDLRDVFAVQDDVSTNIAKTLSVKLTEEEKRQTARKFTVSIEAYDDFLKGKQLYIHRNKQDNLQARYYYQRAIDRDPGFSRAFSAMALTYAAEYRYSWGEGSSKNSLDSALQLAQKGVAINGELPQAHWVVGYVRLFKREYKKAYEAASRAVELDPDFADSYLILAIGELHAQQPEKAVRLIQKAMVLNPLAPTAYDSILGQAYYFMGEYENAADLLSKAVNKNINLLTAHIFLIATLNKMKKNDEASWAVDELKTVAPSFTVDKAVELLPIQDGKHLEEIKQLLRKSGL